LITVSNEETEREITKKLQEKKAKIAFVLDKYNKLIGRYWLEESKKKEQVEIIFDDNPIFTERNNTLNEPFLPCWKVVKNYCLWLTEKNIYGDY